MRISERARGQSETLVDECVTLDQQWRTADFECNAIRKQQNIASKQFGKLMQRLKKTQDAEEKVQIEQERAELKLHIDQLKVSLAEQSTKVSDISNRLTERFSHIGNLVHSSVPRAQDEIHNEVVSQWTTQSDQSDSSVPTTPEGELYHHHQLLAMIGGYQPKQGAALAGHRGYFLTGPGFLLTQALLNHSLATLSAQDYTPVQPPYLLRHSAMSKVAQLEDFDETLYRVEGDGDGDAYLIATSEQPLAALHMKETLTTEQLPLQYAGYSTCFRREAGGHGRDSWGLFRVHQFEKVEQFVLCAPDESWEHLENMKNTAEQFYQGLGLPYRTISIVSGALNNAAAKKYDLEAWFPARQEYRELVSVSNCTDYQSRATSTFYNYQNQKDKNKHRPYVHMLNGTLCAAQRTLCCVLENYQTPEGIRVPKVLQPFVGKDFFPFLHPAPPAAEAPKSDKNKSTHEMKGNHTRGYSSVAARKWQGSGIAKVNGNTRGFSTSIHHTYRPTHLSTRASPSWRMGIQRAMRMIK